MECPALAEPESDLNEVIVPWGVATVEAYNECAKGKETLAAKIREHNKKSEEKQ